MHKFIDNFKQKIEHHPLFVIYTSTHPGNRSWKSSQTYIIENLSVHDASTEMSHDDLDACSLHARVFTVDLQQTWKLSKIWVKVTSKIKVITT